MLSKEELIEGLRSVITSCNEQNDVKVGFVLFGSRSRGEEKEDSDVDLIGLMEKAKTLA